MSVPVIESIAENLLAAINAITEANGFNQTLTAIRPKRLNLDDEITDDLTVIIQQGEAQLADASCSTRDWQQTFYVQAMVIDSDHAETSIETRLNTVRSDIEKKICEDPTRGGYAYQQELEPPEIFVGESFAGVSVPVIINYRTNYNDPYTQ